MEDTQLTNPFKLLAPGLGIRGVVFTLLGLVLLARAVPTLISMTGVPDIPAAVIGVVLLTAGILGLVSAIQRLTRLRKDKLEVSPIDYAYSRGSGWQELPRKLMMSDDNPNEEDQANLIEWLARIFPKLAYIPRPYQVVLHAVLIAASFGVLGLTILFLIRMLLANSTDATQMALIVQWYLWMYFVLGFIVWGTVGWFNFRGALVFNKHLRVGRMVLIFLGLLILAVVAVIFMTRTSSNLFPPPDIGTMTPILWFGSAVAICSTLAIVYLRARQAPDQYSVHRGEEFFTVSMHPTDMVNVIKSFTGKMSGGTYMHLGSWKPEFAEHSAVSAGEFHADLHAESGITLNESPGSRSEKTIGLILAWLGLVLNVTAGFFLFQATSIDWSSSSTVTNAFQLPVAAQIFGTLFYRLGLIPLAELQWNSIITYTHITGTFQAQGGMALMNAGEQSLKGSVLTSATVQPRCAYLTSVGFLRPGLAKHTVYRRIDQVKPAPEISSDILAAVQERANRIMSVGTQPPPSRISLPDNSDDDQGLEENPNDDQAPESH